MSISVRIFVAFIFMVLAASFVTTTAVLYHEFKQTEWLSFAVFYSHLFIFFPIFGVIALAAFYLPACIFMDMYLKYIRFGKLRLAIGATVLVVASYFIAFHLMKGEVPTIWEIAPSILKADKGEQVQGCNPDQQSCVRVPVLEALTTVREKSQTRLGLSKFARECTPDPLVELPQELKEKRFCFVTKKLTDAKNCCKAQKSLTATLVEMNQKEENRSLTAKVHLALLPLKVFFLLILLNIGIMLAVWRNNIDKYYAEYVPFIERGLIVGAAVMLLWPFSNHAYLLSQAVLYGSYSDGIYPMLAPVFSFIFGAWALSLLFFFFRKLEKDMEAVGKIAGVIGSAIAILKYDAIIDYSVRIAGSGADQVTFGLLLILGLLFFVPVILARKKKVDKNNSQS